MPEPSDPVQLLEVLWRQPRGSWSRLNQIMRRGLRLAIEAKLTFAPDDFAAIYRGFRAGYWIGADGLESLYAAACETPNPSAWKALESYMGRRPLFYGGKRLHVGAAIEWQGEHARVTSIDLDGAAFVACIPGAYDHETRQRASHPSRIFRITAEKLKASEKAKRAAAKGATP